jgi:hypothetical protein
MEPPNNIKARTATRMTKQALRNGLWRRLRVDMPKNVRRGPASVTVLSDPAAMDVKSVEPVTRNQQDAKYGKGGECHHAARHRLSLAAPDQGMGERKDEKTRQKYRDAESKSRSARFEGEQRHACRGDQNPHAHFSLRRPVTFHKTPARHGRADLEQIPWAERNEQTRYYRADTADDSIFQ